MEEIIEEPGALTERVAALDDREGDADRVHPGPA